MAYVSPHESHAAKIFGSFYLGIILTLRLFTQVTGVSLHFFGFLGVIGVMLAIAGISAGATWLVLRLWPEPEDR